MLRISDAAFAGASRVIFLRLKRRFLCVRLVLSVATSWVEKMNVFLKDCAIWMSVQDIFIERRVTFYWNRARMKVTRRGKNLFDGS